MVINKVERKVKFEESKQEVPLTSNLTEGYSLLYPPTARLIVH